MATLGSHTRPESVPGCALPHLALEHLFLLLITVGGGSMDRSGGANPVSKVASVGKGASPSRTLISGGSGSAISGASPASIALEHLLLLLRTPASAPHNSDQCGVPQICVGGFLSSLSLEQKIGYHHTINQEAEFFEMRS